MVLPIRPKLIWIASHCSWWTPTTLLTCSFTPWAVCGLIRIKLIGVSLRSQGVLRMILQHKTWSNAWTVIEHVIMGLGCSNKQVTVACVRPVCKQQPQQHSCNSDISYLPGGGCGAVFPFAIGLTVYPCVILQLTCATYEAGSMRKTTLNPS
jgi:hypothetical protein